MADLLELHGPQRTSDQKPIWIAKGYYEIEPSPATDDMHVIQARVLLMEDETTHPNPHHARTIRANFGTREATIQFFEGGGSATVASKAVSDKPDYVYAVSCLVLTSRDASRDDNLLIQNGEISVDEIDYPPNLDDFLGRMLPGFNTFSEVALNADGVSLVAKVKLPWQRDGEEPLHARFQVRIAFGSPSSRQSVRVSLDRRKPAPRQPNGTPGDPAVTLDRFAREFDLLREAVASFKGGHQAQWTELVVSDEAIPAFHWDVVWSSTEATSNYSFDEGSVKLILADAPPDPKSERQRRIVTVHPLARFEKAAVDTLALRLSAGTMEASKARLSYAWAPQAAAEKITLTKLTMGYNALTLARDLRATHGLARPGETPDEHVLWATMPLVDGWMQWPVYNVVEEHYTGRLPESNDNPLVSGAAVFSNQPVDGAAAADEHPWSITVINAVGVDGTWILGWGGDRWTTEKVDFALSEPDLVLDGLLWLAKSPPTIKDALPDLEDFVGTLGSVSLSTNQSAFRFACPLKLNSEITITALSTPDHAPVGRLDDLRLSVQDDASAALKKEWFAGQNEDTFLAPLIWRRHPNLPFIQSLPLTQIQDPPANPNANRELAPFDLPWSVLGSARLPAIDPKVWSFEGAKGATNWLSWLIKSADPVAVEWKEAQRPVLPLASLSVPGLTLQTGNANELPRESGLGLRVQYEFGLPYMDQVEAFAQLPKDEDDEYQGGLFSGPQQSAPKDKLRRPLHRRDFKVWWKELSTKRFLARTEAADAIVNRSTDELAPKFVVQRLIEPLDWPIAPPTVELTSYPGRLKLCNPSQTGTLVLEGTDALRGFDGYFGVVDGGLLRRSAAQPGDFQIIAGSMRAWQETPNGSIRDQRGLSRTHTTQGVNHLDTSIEIDGQTWRLRDWLQSAPLRVGTEDLWQLLITGVALKDGVQFTRRQTLSNQSEDVNDPAALGRTKNPFTGYKWWLGPNSPGPMRLFGLDMQPLALDAVSYDASDNVRVAILARLTVPLPVTAAGITQVQPKPVEQTQRANAVRLTFTGPSGGPLVLASVQSAVKDGVWALAANDDGPVVSWESAQLVAGPALKFGGVRVLFSHFGQPWNVKLNDLVFGGSNSVSSEAALNVGTAEIKVARVELTLDLSDAPDHKIETELGFHWGDAAGLAIETTATYSAWPARGQVRIGAIQLLPKTGAAGLAFSAVSTELPAAALGLQAVFDLKGDFQTAEWSLLPGMQLDMTARHRMCGFLAMSFAASPAPTDPGHRIPSLRMTAGAAEVLLPCRWGASLQDTPADKPFEPDVAFGSSSGDLYANCSLVGSTTRGGGPASWRRRALLNGWLEVKNLVSWPNALAADTPVAAGAASPLSDVKRWTLLFDTAQQTPNDQAEAKKIYQEIAQFVGERGGQLRIEGHADDVGTTSENYHLSNLRAGAVNKQLWPYIKDIKPKPPRVDAIAYGKQRLRIVSSHEDARRQNRRVEIVLTPAGIVIPKRDGSADGWRHFRHTLRVLFNQHELEPKGYAAGSGNVLFRLNNASCQFLAAVEHQLSDVSMDGSSMMKLRRRWRWCAVQEVRFIRPADFSVYLNTTASYHHGLQPGKHDWDTQSLGAAFQSSHREAWLKELKLGQADDQIALLGEDALFVEASVPLWLKIPDAQSERSPTMTALQYLPNAVQTAELAALEDIGLVTQGERSWLSMSMPFIGRLQPPENDIAAVPRSIMMVDAVLWLSRNKPGPSPALCALSCRGNDATSIVVRLSEFEAPDANRWDRLSEGALEEAWFRVQRPPSETSEQSNPAARNQLAPLLEAAPQNSPGRLSRRTALTSVFRAQRNAVPPQEPDEPTGSSLITGDLVWRKSSWFGIQMVSDLPRTSPQAFFLPGYHLRSIWAASREDVSEYVLTCATSLPVNAQQVQASLNQPASLVVSPYRCLGSAHVDIPAERKTVVLTVAEILATVTAENGGDGIFKPAADGMWAGDPGAEKLRLWAIELLSQLAPESPVAVIRVRRTVRSNANPAQTTVEYHYFLATPQTPAPLDPPALTLRSPVADIHYAEGQYGGSLVPNLMPFEVAPPQISGIQPIYSEDLPSECWPSERRRLSALRLSVRNLSPDSRAVVGTGIDQDAGKPARLWWQAVSSQVAFDSETQGRKVLPQGFRSPPRAAWLAASARLSGPPFRTLPLAPEPPEPRSSAPPAILQWQPVMPHDLDVVIAGSRAGAPVALRVLTETETSANGQLVPSASVPVQQRMPRPVSLPPNRQSAVERAQRPWAALWLPEDNCLESPESLTDIAIYDLGSIAQTSSGGKERKTKRFGLRLKLEQAALRHVSLTAGASMPILGVDASWYSQNDSTGAWAWTELKNGDLTYTPEALQAFFVGEGIRRKITLKSGDSSPFWADLDGKDDIALNGWIAKQPHGAPAWIEIRVPPPEESGFVKGYCQTLRLPLRIRRPNIPCAPLQPQIVHFEDPAYNRKLTSTPAQRSGRLCGDDDGKVTVGVTLASDRREYNADSELLLVFARNDTSDHKFEARLSLRRQDRDGNKTTLCGFDPDGQPVERVANRVVAILKLSNLRTSNNATLPTLALQPDDLLYILIERKSAGSQPPTIVELPVKIVAKPVLPPPSEGYALLRETTDGAAKAVHTARFAWSPEPSRVELINPDDLLGAAVRRRAVFRWSDSPRSPGPKLLRYRVQKITGSGATHWPLLN
jgi:outer membrane protein OmpA-like peptidoglycan-associated protein